MKVLEVISQINRGGFGVIDMVKCSDGLMYARKTFSPSNSFLLPEDFIKKLRDRFVREVSYQANMPADLFIPILYSELDSESPWFIMPIAEKVYIDEINAARVEGRVPDGLSDILNSMEFIHSAGLVHRDIKPQNILFHDGRWKLSDFGLISQNKELSDLSLTSTGDKFLTERYCSPEQLVNFKRVTFKADIYSFGAILHDIFSGTDRVPYSELSADGEIGLIISKCTKKDPEQRFSDVNSLRESLLSVLSKESGISLNQDEQQIAHQLLGIDAWNSDDFEKFIYYIKRFDYNEFRVFLEFNEEIFTKFKSISVSLFNEISLMYCEWVIANIFKYDYCDVIVNHLLYIYNNTDDVDLKASVILATANLGRKHNRWYVMHRLINLCDVSMPERLAFRISLEVGFNKNSKQDLISCAEVLGYSMNVYHKIVADALSK